MARRPSPSPCLETALPLGWAGALVVFEDFTPQAPSFDFFLAQVLAGPHENFHYVVGDPAGRRAVVIDPAFELDKVFAIAEEDGYRIDRALFTHGHWDHIGGLPDILERGVEKVGIHEAAAGHPKIAEYREAGGTVRLLSDGEVLDVGGVPIRALHTPGHQPESTCYLVGDDGQPQALFGGDTLFIDTCGRTDFPGGDTDAMFASMARLRRLAGDIIVFPGHHYADRAWEALAEQITKNPALATEERGAFGKLHCLTH